MACFASQALKSIRTTASGAPPAPSTGSPEAYMFVAPQAVATAAGSLSVPASAKKRVAISTPCSPKASAGVQRALRGKSMGGFASSGSSSTKTSGSGLAVGKVSKKGLSGIDLNL